MLFLPSDLSSMTHVEFTRKFFNNYTWWTISVKIFRVGSIFSNVCEIIFKAHLDNLWFFGAKEVVVSPVCWRKSRLNPLPGLPIETVHRFDWFDFLVQRRTVHRLDHYFAVFVNRSILSIKYLTPPFPWNYLNWSIILSVCSRKPQRINLCVYFSIRWINCHRPMVLIPCHGCRPHCRTMWNWSVHSAFSSRGGENTRDLFFR